MKMTSRMFVVLALAASVAGNAFALAIDGNEWQDLTRMSAGREKTRASFAPFPDEQSALAILPDKTPRQICLDSLTAWKFKWSKDPASRPVGFEKPNYDVSSWEVIRVPCSWQAFEANGRGGWGTPLYTNARYPFKVNPPRVMDEPPKDFTSFAARNPVGSYRRDFRLPTGWQPPAVVRSARPPFRLPATYSTGMIRTGSTELEELARETGAGAFPSSATVGGVEKRGFYMHPPYRGVTGSTFMRWKLTLPDEPLDFVVDVGKVDRSSLGDGTLYRIEVADGKGRHPVASLQTNEHKWQTLTADLSPWRGKTVRLYLISDPGPARNHVADHSSWADLRFCSRSKRVGK